MKTKLISIVLFNLVFVVSLFAQKEFSNNKDNRTIKKGQLLENTQRINHFQLHETSITAVIFEEKFENNLSEWNAIGEWEKGVPNNTLLSGRKISTCIGTNLKTNYSNSGQSILYSPLIKLPEINSEEQLVIYFDEFYQIENEYDKASVFISYDSGKKWKNLSSRSGKSEWRNTMVNISAFSEKEIQLAFVLNSDDSENFIGWYIDDLKIVKQKAIINSNQKSTIPLEVIMNSLNSRNFPYIYMNVSVDSYGLPLQTLEQSNFEVFEDGVLQTDYFEVIPPEQGGSSRLADIVFLVDNSGSFDVYQNAALNNMISFVNQLVGSDIDYALGLCRFGQGDLNGNPIIEDAGQLTSDVDYFKNDVWLRNLVDGGTEPAYYAITQSIAGFNFRPGSQKVFIILADEDPNQGGATQQDAIDACLASSVTLFALTTVDSYGLNDVASQTNGSSYNITDPFNDILDDIGNLIADSYLVTYRTSNPSYDGMERNIKVDVRHDGYYEYVTGSYVPGSSPSISRTKNTIDLHLQAWPELTTFVIEVEITDTYSPFTQSATLFYKTATEAVYQYVAMTNTYGNFWEATIDPAVALQPGVDYYISATDGQSTSTAPSTSPSISPFQIPMLPNIAPVIVHTPVTSVSNNTPIIIMAEITDNTNSLDAQYLFYRKTGQLTYQNVAMTNIGGNSFEAEIPANYVTLGGVDYFIEATDNFGVSSYFGSSDYPIQPTILWFEEEIGFRPEVNGWQFLNTQEEMWPESWWSQFDYTRYPYPWDWRFYESERFPDWPLFVETFGEDYCYLDPPPGKVTIDPKAELIWKSISQRIDRGHYIELKEYEQEYDYWQGSGFGFAATSLLIYDGYIDQSALSKSYPIYDLENNDEIRKLINKYYLYQFGKEQQLHMNTVWNFTPVETLDAVKESFKNETDNIILSMKNYIDDDGKEVIRGGHAVIPYKISVDTVDENIEYIHVYDYNMPGEENFVVVNTLSNEWSYEPLGWGYHKGLLPRESIKNYTNTPSVSKDAGQKEDEYLTVYKSGFNDVVIVNGDGDTIGFHDGELFENIFGGHPIVVDNPNANSDSPLGYFILEDEYSFHIQNYEDTTAKVSVLTDDASYNYSRNGVNFGEEDNISFKNGINVTSTDATTKNFDLETILTDKDEKKVFSIKNCQLTNGDSLKFAHSVGKKMNITNLGAPNTYDLGLKISSKSTNLYFESKRINFKGNSRHRIKSNFSLGKNGELFIEIDEDLDGVFEDSVAVVNEFVPPPPIVYDSVICEDQAVPDKAAVGEELKWYSDAGLTGLVHTGHTYPKSVSGPGKYTFFVTQTIYSIESEGSKLSLTIHSKQKPAVTDQFGCEGNAIPHLEAFGDNLRWYADKNLTNLLYTGNDFSTGQQLAGTYTYYITNTNEGCGVSETTVATLTIFDGVPTPPVAISRTFCDGDQIFLSATGSNITWYDDAGLTNQVSTGSIFYPQGLGLSTYNYYVTQSLESCGESTAAQVNLTINAIPDSPTGDNVVVCQGENVPALAATGNSLTWYSNANLTQVVNTGNSFITGMSNPGVYNYYITQFSGNCESTPSTISLSINPLPLVATIPSGLANLCDNTGTNNYIISGVQFASEYNWNLSPATAGSISGTGTTATVDWNNNFTGKAYVSVQGENSCGTGDFSRELEITVNTVPAQPEIPSGPVSICDNVLTSSYYIPALNNVQLYEWTINPQEAGILIAQNNALNINWNVNFIGNVSLSVLGKNSCGTGQSSSALNISRIQIPEKASISRDVDDLISSSTDGNQWFSQEAGLLLGETDQVFTPAHSGNYYVMVKNGNCYSISESFYFIATAVNSQPANSTVTIYPNPAKGKITILNIEEPEIYIYDVFGKLHFQKNMKKSEKTLDISMLNEGTYIVKVVKGNKVESILISTIR